MAQENIPRKPIMERVRGFITSVRSVNYKALFSADRLRDKYLLKIMKSETFEEMFTFNLSLASVYTALSSAIVGLAILVVSLIIFTPLKRYIPGYGDTAQARQMMELNDKLDQIGDEVVAQRHYTDNFRKMLTNDVETTKDAKNDPIEDVSKTQDSMTRIGIIPEEKLLRQEYESGQKASGSVPKVNTAPQGVNYVPKEISLAQMYIIAPLSGEISRGLRPMEQHFGIDLLAPKNTAVKTVLDGYVVFSDFTVETGNTIGVQHANNVVTFYKHNSSLLKKMGDYVTAGEAIAIIGNTGTKTNGPHLHFELWYKGRPVDPTEYINFK